MREPEIEGRGVQAWRVKMAAPPACPPDWTATIASWLVRCNWAHPAWQWWLVSVYHLRAIEGVKPATKHYPEAEFEFMIAALDPSKPHPDPDNPGGGYSFLQPIDVVHQFHGVSDRDAGRICEAAVRAIAAGSISPDQDYRRAWRESLDSTVQHYRSGAHVEH